MITRQRWPLVDSIVYNLGFVPGLAALTERKRADSATLRAQGAGGKINIWPLWRDQKTPASFCREGPG